MAYISTIISAVCIRILSRQNLVLHARIYYFITARHCFIIVSRCKRFTIVQHVFTNRLYYNIIGLQAQRFRLALERLILCAADFISYQKRYFFNFFFSFVISAQSLNALNDVIIRIMCNPRTTHHRMRAPRREETNNVPAITAVYRITTIILCTNANNNII